MKIMPDGCFLDTSCDLQAKPGMQILRMEAQILSLLIHLAYHQKPSFCFQNRPTGSCQGLQLRERERPSLAGITSQKKPVYQHIPKIPKQALLCQQL